MRRYLYSFLLYCISPLIVFRLLWRAIQNPEYLLHWPERWGYYPDRNRQRPIIWLHAVSVGEAMASQPLILGLQQVYPDHQILVTHMTPTGRKTIKRLFGDQVIAVYLAYDLPCAVQRFLRHYQPRFGLLMETEIWINLIFFCHRMRIPLLLVNARLSEQSRSGYARLGSLMSDTLKRLTAIAAQTQQDAERLAQLGGQNIQVLGNLKFDVEPPYSPRQQGTRLKIALRAQSRPIFLAASTRAGEEAIILDALQLVDVPDLLTIIVPRHPQRFAIVAELLHERGLYFVRRSANASAHASCHIVLGDSMGEMHAYCYACDVAFIGGSLLPLGGQNLIEAASQAKPILVGPHTWNFEEITAHAVEQGAALRVHRAADLAEALNQLFHNPNLCANMGQRSRQLYRDRQGATQRHLAFIQRVISADG